MKHSNCIENPQGYIWRDHTIVKRRIFEGHAIHMRLPNNALMPIFLQASKELKDCNNVTSTYDAEILKWCINPKKNGKIRKCCIVNKQTT